MLFVVTATDAAITSTPLLEDIRLRLNDLGPSSDGNDVVIPPAQPRDGLSYYVADDLETVKLARKAGLNADYLSSPMNGTISANGLPDGFSNRHWRSLGNLTTAAIIAAPAYIRYRARAAVQGGNHPGSESQVPIQLRVTLAMAGSTRRRRIANAGQKAELASRRAQSRSSHKKHPWETGRD